MKKGNLFLLGLGYAAGLLVALKFAADGKKKTIPEIAEDIKAIHKNLWTEGEEKIFSPENRERVARLKVQALKEIDSFKKEANKTIAELTKKGELKRDEIEDILKDLYARRKEILEDLMEEASDLAEDGLEEGEEIAKKLAKKIRSLAKDLKSELEKTYKDLKKKIK